MAATKIAVFYHGVFAGGNPVAMLPAATEIIDGQMRLMKSCGLLDAYDEFHIGINGGGESSLISKILFPEKAKVSFHGTHCKNELRTILLLEEWVKTRPDWNVLYFHSKGATHPIGHDRSIRWRNCMMKHLVTNWRKCVSDLDSGKDSVGCHWAEPPKTPPGQFIWCGNFWWAKSDFLKTLPSLMLRQRIALSGLDSVESRFEAEVWLGNGKQLPKIMDYHPEGFLECP